MLEYSGVYVKTYERASTLGIVALRACAAIDLAAQTSGRQAARTFMPERFYNTFSFAHAPAIRIKPGERIVTKTADAAGVDWNGKQVAQGPNPQTGPFFVEGAEPGDMLVVSLKSWRSTAPPDIRAACWPRTPWIRRR